MTTKDADLKFTIGADSSKYERAMDRVKSGARSAGKIVKAGFAAATAAVGALSGALLVASKDVLKFGDQIHKANLRLGISTEALSQLRHAADLSGVSFESLQNGLRYMERQLSEVAAKGKGPAKEALDALGLSIQDLRGLKPETQFEIISEQLSKVADSTDKAAIAAKLYGARGVELIQMAADGASGIRAMREEADSLGLTLSQDGANAIADFNDTMTRLKGEFTGTAQALVVALGPVLTDFIKWFGEYLPDAINITIEAYNFLSRAMVGAFKVGVAAGEKFYTLLGKIPGRIGAPYREAAASIAEVRRELENFNAAQIDLIQAKGAGKVFGEGADFNFSSLGGVASPSAVNNEKEVEIEQDKQQRLREIRFAARAETNASLLEHLEEKRRIAAQELADAQAAEEAKVAMQKAAGKTALNNAKGALAEFGKTNAAAFEAFKAVSISETVVNTYASAVAAYKALAGIPYVGPVLGAAAAAAAVAYGMAQVSAISAMTPGAKGSAVGTTSAATTSTSIPTGTTSGTSVDPSYATEEKKGNYTFHIHGDFVGDEAYIDRLAEKLNIAIEDRNVSFSAGY